MSSIARCIQHARVKTEKGKATTLLFYTSDLEGEFKVVVEGFTHQGEAIRGETSFRVGE